MSKFTEYAIAGIIGRLQQLGYSYVNANYVFDYRITGSSLECEM